MAASDVTPLDTGYQLVRRSGKNSGNPGWWEVQYDQHEFARLPGVLTLEEAFELGRLLAHLHKTRTPPPHNISEHRIYL